MYIISLLLSLLLLQNAYALDIGCTHPQICNIANEMLLKNKAILLKKMSGDPHHDKLTSSEIKKIVSIDLLLLSPLSLQPWSSKIEQLRKKQTIKVILNPEVSQMYLGYSKHILAHFWLIPQQSIFIAKYLSAQFTKLNIPHKQLEVAKQLAIYEKRKMISPCLKNSTIILSHNALLPYIIGLPKSVISIKSSNHHRQLTPKKLKQVKMQLNSSRKNTDKIIWIIEKNIHLPAAVKEWIKSTDIIIQFDALGRIGQRSSLPLETLIKKLKQKTCLKN